MHGFESSLASGEDPVFRASLSLENVRSAVWPPATLVAKSVDIALSVGN